MKTLPTVLFCTLSVVALGLISLPATAQIEKMSSRKLRAQNRQAERQARHIDRTDETARELKATYLNMDAYNMKPNEVGHKAVNARDGRENYQFNKKGEAQVTEASVLTRKRLKKNP